MSPLGGPPPVIGLGGGDPQLATIGTGKSIPPGLEAKLEFNGLLLNDRSVVDTYKVTRISGLEDADIRDDREVNPQQHGETAFDSWYGGRTIAIEGTIRAFNLAKLRDMEQALKQAFADLSQEYPLTFHQHDPDNDVLIMCKKNVPIAMTEEQLNDGIFYRPFLITLRASNFRYLALANEFEYVEMAQIDDATQDNTDSYDITGSNLSVSGGVWTFQNTSNKTLIWKNSGIFPQADTEIILKYIPDSTFTGSRVRVILKWQDANNYIYGQVNATGTMQIYKRIAGTDTAIGSSVAYGSRTNVPYWVKLKITGNTINFRQYTEDPRGNPAATSSGPDYTLAGAEIDQFGAEVNGRMGWDMQAGSTSWQVDDISFGVHKLDEEPALSVINHGNFSAQPTLQFGGPMDDPMLVNAQTTETIVITGSVPSNDNWEINVGEGTMEDVAGDNRFNNLSPASDWMELVPGPNDLLLTVQGANVRRIGSTWIIPSVSVSFRSSWI